MKKLPVLILFGILSFFAQAQDFAGYRTGNNTGVNGVFFNPASIADSRYRWDFTLFNVSAAVGNNKATFKLKDIGKTLDGDSIKNKIFGSAGTSSGAASVAVTGPSLFFNLGRKSALAITSRARAMANVIDVDGKLAQQLIDDANGDVGLPYTIASTSNQIAVVNGWTEFGLSYARVLMDKGRHFLKGGISGKYLAGAANASVTINSLKGTIAADVVRDEAYLTAASGRIDLNFGGIQLDDLNPSDLLSFSSTGIGADIGFVYEYRPDTSTTLRNATGGARRDLNKYKLRVGLAVLDIGSIKYTRDVSRSGSYTTRITATQRFYLQALSDAGVDGFKDTLNAYPQFFTPNGTVTAGKYTVALPATVQLDVDYHLHRKLYINVGVQLALTKTEGEPSANRYYNAVSLTPRYEGRGFGFYLPLTYNALTEFTGGAAFRLGPLFFGSGSVLSAALGNSRQADFFVGLHFGGLHSKHRQPRKEAN